MAPDDGVVHVDARVDERVRIAAAFLVSIAHRGIQKRRVLRGVDLDIRAAEPDQLLDLAPREVDHVGEVGVARRVGAGGVLGIVVRRGLLRADQRDLQP